MLSSLFWGIVVRTGQIAAESSTTLLCGLLVAGIMRCMLGAEGTRRLFGGPGWKGLLRAWGVGTVLPVCSLGVIPIAREMRRAGVRSGTILAFVMAAPHINPLSLLYGLTLSEPLVIICFAVGSLLLALLAGAVWDKYLDSKADEAEPSTEPTPAPGIKRLVAVIVAAAREAVNPTMGFILIGIVFTGIMAGALPHGMLGQTMQHKDWLAPLEMTAFALPAYLGPLQGMMRLGLIFEHGNSVGAGFVLFELGIGINVGLICWLMTLFGWRRVLLWLAILTGATLALAYASERPLYFSTEEAGHTHAFDDWTCPFQAGESVPLAMVANKILQKVEILEPVSLTGLGFLVLVGVALLKLDPSRRIDAYLATAQPSEVKTDVVWNRHVPGPVLGFTALVGLVVFSIVALYLYYPAPEEAFAEIGNVRTEALAAVTSGHKDEAIRQIQHWDLMTRKLQVGVFIRTGRMNAEASKAAEDLRERLEDLRDELLASRLDEAKKLVPKVQDAYWKCRGLYLPGQGKPAILETAKGD
jgi:uncharacterized membrane protein YraQ (UPF0718 family)